MAIGSAPEIGATFVTLETWEDKLAFMRQWRSTVGDNGVGGYGTLVPRSEIKDVE